MHILVLIILGLLIIYFISIAKVYHSIPLIELKRRARAGQSLSRSLYRVASYKFSSQFLLLVLATLSSAAFFLIVSEKSPVWVAITVNFALIWLAYVWIPRSGINTISEYLAQISARPLGFVLQYLHPFLTKFSKYQKHTSHTGLYESSDIVRLLARQKTQDDNRIQEFELDLLEHVVNFNELSVMDIMTPKRKVNAISADETLGPIVLSELYNTKHSYFPVYSESPEEIVGILSLSALAVPKNSTKAKDAMTETIYYVHEEQYLAEVLQLMIKTSHELFIVVNSQDDYVGIITAREVLKKLLGEVITDEFDDYDKRELVAQRYMQQPIENEEKDTKTDEEPTEVIE